MTGGEEKRGREEIDVPPVQKIPLPGEYQLGSSMFYDSSVWHPQQWRLTVNISKTLAVACNARGSMGTYLPITAEEVTHS